MEDIEARLANIMDYSTGLEGATEVRNIIHSDAAQVILDEITKAHLWEIQNRDWKAFLRMGGEVDVSLYGEEPWLADIFRMEERLHVAAFQLLRTPEAVRNINHLDLNEWFPDQWTNEELQRILELDPSALPGTWKGALIELRYRRRLWHYETWSYGADLHATLGMRPRHALFSYTHISCKWTRRDLPLRTRI